jgi:F0F1-type ATP synthase assembly protein I
MYIAGITITFAIKNTKIVGTILLGIGIIAMVVTNGWGLIAFALLLPAGIVVLRQMVWASPQI